jgi:hypothetical protein
MKTRLRCQSVNDSKDSEGKILVQTFKFSPESVGHNVHTEQELTLTLTVTDEKLFNHFSEDVLYDFTALAAK